MGELAKLLIIFGLVLVGLGLLLLIVSRVPLLGRLPGDFSFSWGGVTVYVPLATSLILSALLTLILNLVLRR